METLDRGSTYVLNHCAKYLARDAQPARHSFGRFDPTDPRGRFAEGWRFPIVDEHWDPELGEASRNHNQVTFVYRAEPAESLPSEVAVVGDFDRLYNPTPLARVDGSIYFARTFVLPVGRAFRYRFLVDSAPLLDPVNPQGVTLPDGKEWSRFFTRGCTQPLSFEPWELRLLDRLTDHILPLNTEAGERFVRSEDAPNLYRLDQSVGVVNFIDKLLAREESHHRIDYAICLELIDGILRQRNPFEEPHLMQEALFVELYDQMAGEGPPPGWDTSRYSEPRYFLQLLRRHTVTGVFAHPRHGGNREAAGWAFLADRYRAADGTTLFDWRRAIERPLGQSPDYRG